MFTDLNLGKPERKTKKAWFMSSVEDKRVGKEEKNKNLTGLY